MAENASARSTSASIAAAELASEAFDLRRMIETTAQPVATAADGKGLVLEIRTADGLPDQVIGNGSSVRRVLSTLLENAVECTDSGEIVASVTAHETGRGRVIVHFEVSDTGPGLPVQALDGAASGGLAEARELVELMDGRMECASAAGLGSTLSFRVPLDLLG